MFGGLRTVRFVLPAKVPVPDVAVIVVPPASTPIAIPFALMDATDGLDELHDTSDVRSTTLPSLKVPVA